MNIFRQILQMTGAALVAAALVSCGGEAAGSDNVPSESGQKVESFAFSRERISVKIGTSVRLELVNISGTDTTGLYDMVSNPYGILLSSSDKSVATVDAAAMLSALSKGKTTVSAYSAKLGKTRSISVAVVDETGDSGSGGGDGGEDLSYYHFNQDLSQPFSADNNIYLKDCIVHATMQGCDVDSKGTPFVSWEEDEQVHISNGSFRVRSKDMVAKYASHGDGFCVDEKDGDCYVWCSGSTSESYQGQRFVVRYKFQQGKIVYPEECYEGFWWDDAGATVFSVDVEHDYFAYQISDNIGVYRYSEMKKAPMKELSIIRADRKADKVQVHDLSKITPVAKFKYDRTKLQGIRAQNGAVRAIQGFCTYDGLIYLSMGFKEEPVSNVSILDFQGKEVAVLTPLEVSRDRAAIKAAGLTSNTTLEHEGMQIHRGVMYLGFVGDFAVSGETKHACILKLN